MIRATTTTPYPATIRRVVRRVSSGGPPRQLTTSTRQEALNALSRQYTKGAETLVMPVTSLTFAIVGGAAKKNTRPASESSAHTDRSSGSRQERMSAGALTVSATPIAAAGM